ncbi:MAG: hypothetical protein LAO04_00065 [Acidobacteriia bacterium]|nr:hypothetical protein [Terriglobia bacterium]
MTNDKNLQPPKPGGGDIAHTVVKAGLSAIPIVGGPAAELFSALLAPPLAKRRDNWVRSIAEGLEELEEKVSGFTVDSLRENEAFVTAVMHASQAAVRNHHQEKLEALRNAVLNVASGNAPDEDLQLMFLNFIDTLTPWHLRILRFLQGPAAYRAAKGMTSTNQAVGSPARVIEHTFPELRGQRAFYDQIVSDLFSRGLMNSEPSGLHAMMTASGVLAKRTTPMGDAFLAFVSSPHAG